MGSPGPFAHRKPAQARWGSQTTSVLLLLGVICLLQVLYQGHLMRIVQQEHEHMEDACGGGATGLESSQCLEQRIFKGWQEEALREEREGPLLTMTVHRDHHEAHVSRVVDAVVEVAKT